MLEFTPSANQIDRDYIEFINYAFLRHLREHPRADFETCSNRTCRRARQLEIYLILAGRWADAVVGWLSGQNYVR